MLKARNSADKFLMIFIGLLLVVGFFVFVSASLGILARSNVSIFSIALNHIILGVGVGLLSLYIVSKVNYRIWKKWAPYLFVFSAILTALVFIPGIGLESGGAKRWLLLGPISFQPAEALKISSILMLAAYFAKYRTQLGSLKYGLGMFLAILAVPAVILLLQPDTGTLIIIGISAAAMFLVAGARWRHIGMLFIIGLIGLSVLMFYRPYVLDRVTTFINPFNDPQGSSYQVRQSLIAVGSGGTFGRGFGQSIQKFSYLPEPMSDSIFAVAAEEFGLLGSLTIVGLFLGFAARGFSIAARAPDYFGGVLAVGITVYIVGQAFINIAAMLSLAPLTGIPLIFISQGGTAMLVALGSAGILLNISRYAKTK
jgi:cell division protein FtsW